MHVALCVILHGRKLSVIGRVIQVWYPKWKSYKLYKQLILEYIQTAILYVCPKSVPLDLRFEAISCVENQVDSYVERVRICSAKSRRQLMGWSPQQAALLFDIRVYKRINPHA